MKFTVRIDDISGKLTKLLNLSVQRKAQKMDESSRRATERYVESLISKARELAPEGKLDEYPTRIGQRPSERFGQVPINKSLTSTIDFGPTSLERERKTTYTVRILSSADHAKYFTKGIPEKFSGGTQPHRIPLTGTMTDRGHPMTFHFKGLNYKVWTQIGIKGGLHPGIVSGKFGDFIADAVDEVRFGDFFA